MKFTIAAGTDYIMWRTGGGGRSERSEVGSGAGDVTALATECLSEAGASCTCINLGKQTRVCAWGE